jgi:hypothetical protein
MNIENIAPILTSSGFGMMGGFSNGFCDKKSNESAGNHSRYISECFWHISSLKI